MSATKKPVESTHSYFSPLAQSSSATKGERNGERSPSVSFMLNKVKSPSSMSLTQQPLSETKSQSGSVGYQSAYDTQEEKESSSLSSRVVNRLSDNYERRDKSLTSESLCNFSDSTPYRVDSRAVAPFSSDEHGGVIGSPLSAFSAVAMQNSNKDHDGPFSAMRSANRSASDIGALGHYSGREPSLLVSPRFIPNENGESTPATVRRSLGNAFEGRDSGFSSNTHKSDPIESKVNNGQRDPTPYNERSNPNSNILTSPTGSISSSAGQNPIMRSGGSSSDSSSRSGRDPPAKSPFHAGVAANPFQKHNTSHHSHLHHHAPHEENELSMIEENTSVLDESGMLNQSHVSTVTAFTLPRTPVMRKVNQTADGTNSVMSTGLGNTPVSTATLLHNPSQAMRKFFNQIANQTSHRLEDIWDSVGVAPDERAAQLADLMEKVVALCDEKIAGEHEMEEQFKKSIVELRQELEDSCQALQIGVKDPAMCLRRDPSASTIDNGGVTLQTEYEALLARLENIRAAKDAATGDIKVSQNRIYEAYAALNDCSVEEAASSPELELWKDISSNLTEEHRDLFRAKAEEFEESVASRTKAVVSLLRDCQHLIRELDIVPHACLEENENGSPFRRASGDYGPGGAEEVGRSEDDIKIMKSLKLIDNSTNENDRRRSRGRFTSDYTIASIFETPTSTGIGNGALDRLTKRLAELNVEKKRRRARLAELGGAIAALWTMLRVSPEEQSAFTGSVRGLGMDTIIKGERELARLEDLKGEMIGKLIQEQRVVIQDLWERTNSSDAEKATFASSFNITKEDLLTDDLLEEHKKYVASLNAKLEKMQPILDLIAKRESIIADRFELENLQKDPDRLKQRGAVTQLLKEEKMARRVKKELPKITQILERTLMEWYEDNKPANEQEDEDSDLGHFMYKNAPYLKIMHDQEEDWRARKEKGEKERHRKRQEERSTSSSSAFGSTYTKLPGKKWHPTNNGGHGPKHGTNDSTSDRPRSASNVRGRPLADVSSNRQNISRAVSRPRNDREKKHVNSGVPSHRAISAPRMRMSSNGAKSVQQTNAALSLLE